MDTLLLIVLSIFTFICIIVAIFSTIKLLGLIIDDYKNYKKT